MSQADLGLKAVRRMRLERAAICVHRMGPRVFFELLKEVGQHNNCEADVAARLESYAAKLTPEMIAVTGADRFAPWRPVLVQSTGF